MKRSRPSDAGGAKPAAKKGGDASAGKRRLLDSDCDDDAGADSTGTATDDSEGTNMVEFGEGAAEVVLMLSDVLSAAGCCQSGARV